MSALRPGVYVERADAARGDAVVLRTDIAAFVGIAERGPLDVPVPVESMRQFVAHYGQFIGAGYLAYAVRGFFENGGRRCWCVRVASRDATAGARSAAAIVADIDGAPALDLAANSPGAWGEALTLEWAASGQRATRAAGGWTPMFAAVESTTGFAAGDLVRIDQSPLALTRVVIEVDAGAKRLYWVAPRPERRGARDLPLLGPDPTGELRITRLAYALTIRAGGRVIATYTDLHLPAEHPRHIGRVLTPVDYDRRTQRGLPRAPEPVVAVALIDADALPRPLQFTPGVRTPLRDGRDGLALLVAGDFLGEAAAPGDSDIARAAGQRGLEALAPIDEIALVAMPDALIQPEPEPDYLPLPVERPDPCLRCPPPAQPRASNPPRPTGELPPAFDAETIARLQAALLAHCERLGDRFAVLGLPYALATDPAQPRQAAVAWRERYTERCGALYAPWIAVFDPRTAATRVMPPCGHVLGAIAATDRAHGVFRAPGNVALSGVVRCVREFDDDDHGELNGANVDVVRGEFGRDHMLAGARTLSPDPQWRYINVVRLMLTLKKAIDISLRWVVFEPNDAGTRNRVAGLLRGLLGAFFARGAFAGDRADDAYFVRCDDTTTDAADRDAGRLIAQVGFAPAAPCEFIVLRVGRERNTLSVALDDARQAQP